MDIVDLYYTLKGKILCIEELPTKLKDELNSFIDEIFDYYLSGNENKANDKCDKSPVSQPMKPKLPDRPKAKIM